jgi:hypothetical protein
MATNARKQPQGFGGEAMSRTGGYNYTRDYPVAPPRWSDHTTNNNTRQTPTNTFHHRGAVTSSSAESHGSMTGTVMPMDQGSEEEGGITSSASAPLGEGSDQTGHAVGGTSNDNGNSSQGTMQNPSNKSTSGDRNNWREVVMGPSKPTPHTLRHPGPAAASAEPHPRSTGVPSLSPESRPHSTGLSPPSPEWSPQSPVTPPPPPESRPVNGTNRPFNGCVSLNLLTAGFPEGQEPKAVPPSGY